MFRFRAGVGVLLTPAERRSDDATQPLPLHKDGGALGAAGATGPSRNCLHRPRPWEGEGTRAGEAPELPKGRGGRGELASQSVAAKGRALPTCHPPLLGEKQKGPGENCGGQGKAPASPPHPHEATPPQTAAETAAPGGKTSRLPCVRATAQEAIRFPLQGVGAPANRNL